MTHRVYYVCRYQHTYTMSVFAAFYAGNLSATLRIVPYGVLPNIRSFAPGAFIFTDLDRLHPAERDRLIPLIDGLCAQGCTVLNHPTRSLRRFDLLRRLHEAGINDFNVYRLPDWREARRFPVFVRRESGHHPPVSPMLPDRAALEVTVAKLSASRDDLADLMIVEFSNAPDANGRYRKYAAFRVGKGVYAQHCLFSDDWWIKFSNASFGDGELEEHFRYVGANPHREQLERAFELGRLDYGRADYCMLGDRMQIFEINTNPIVITIPPGFGTDRTLYARLHEDALGSLLGEATTASAATNPLFIEGRPERDPDAVHARLLAKCRANWAERSPETFDAGRGDQP